MSPVCPVVLGKEGVLAMPVPIIVYVVALIVGAIIATVYALDNA